MLTGSNADRSSDRVKPTSNLNVLVEERVELFKNRNKRRDRPKKRLRSAAPLVAGLLCATVLGQLALGEKGMVAIAAAVKDPSSLLRDPSSLLAARSPGERGEGAMYSTKGARKVASGTPGTGSPKDAPPANAVGGGTPGLPSNPSAFGAIPTDSVPDGFVTPVGGPGGPVIGTDSTPGTAPLAPVPGVPLPGPNVSPPTPPVVTPVPEPGTWAMLIIGFFMTGMAIRRAKRAGAVKQDGARQPQ